MLMLGRKPVSPLCMPYAGFEKATNCILEIPQNLKMEIDSDDYVVLKAGSTFVVANGSTYTTFTTSADIKTKAVVDSHESGNLYYFIPQTSGNAQIWKTVNSINSVSDLPTPGERAEMIFVAGEKKYYFHSGSGTAWNPVTVNGYPACVLKRENNAWSFAKDDNGNDIIFNDFSIIGHHYIGYPNDILGLGCDGFNTDGSYKTTYIHRNALYIFELPKTYVSFVLKPNGTLFGGGWDPNTQLPYEEVNELPTTYVAANIYVKNENQVYRWSDNESAYQIQNNSLYYGYINLSSTGIFRSMAIQQPLTKYRWVVKLIP